MKKKVGQAGRQLGRQTGGMVGFGGPPWEMEMAQTTTRVNGKGLWQIPTFPLDSA